jgi:NAD(P)-dependent dehydrogenase (short-subunit alcohol dehydrogenase family)
MRTRRFDDKVAVVTGAGAGIGEASAKRLAEEGAAVLVTDIDAGAAERVAAEIRELGGKAVAQALDVSNEAQISAAVERAVREWGRLDILHNNAAATSSDFGSKDLPVVELDAAYFMRTLEINLLGPMLGCKHAIPRMLENGGGAIVNTSSGAGSGGSPTGRTAYGASKAGLESLTRSVAVQYGKQGIRCNAIAPGITLSLTAEQSMPASALDVARHAVQVPDLAKPEDQASVVAFLASDDAGHINGQVIHTGGGGNIVSTTNALLAYAQAVGALRESPYVARP